MEYDKINGNVGFREADHYYGNLNDPTIKYTSVTTLIGKYELPYDRDFWSKYKALERLVTKEEWKEIKPSLLKTEHFDNKMLEVYNVSESDLNREQQDILDEWAETNRVACERGTKIHSQMENGLYNTKGEITLKKYGIGGKFICKKDYNELNLDYGIYPEYLVYYDNPKINLHIAGQIDLLIKNGNNIIIGDYKTNSKLDFKSFFNPYNRKKKMMKYPLGTIEDCNFNHYQLQLSTYAWMIQKLNPEFNIERLFIIHFEHSGDSKIYEVQYLKNEVEKMLKHFAKQNKLENLNKKYERIQY